MAAIRRILVAIKDPTAKKQPAVAKAAQIATAFGSKIELFHDMTGTRYTGFPGGLVPDPHAVVREHRAARLDQLERLAAPLRDRGLDVTSAAEWDFPAHEAIVRRALTINSDLIVAQHHPRKHHLTLFLSFTDWELLRLSPLPVLLVKSSRPYRHPVVLAAVDPLHAFGKPARLDASILRLGATIAEGLRGKLHAVHVYSTLPVPIMGADGRVNVQMQREIADIAGAAFDDVLRSMNIPPPRRHLVDGEPAERIAAVARKTGSAIVVMGAVSRSGIRRAFIGNTAERLIDELRSDLLVVKPANFTTKVPRAQRGNRVMPRATAPP